MIGKDTALYGATAGAVAIALYLLASGQQDAERQVRAAEHTVESAKFDADFARATGRVVNAERAQDDVKTAQARLEKARAIAERRMDEKTAQEQAILSSVRQDIKQKSDGEMDLDAALAKLK